MSLPDDRLVALRFLSVVPNRSATHALRQREVLTALSRTAAHPAFGSVLLLVRSLAETHAMLAAFGYVLPPQVSLVELGRWPLNSDLVEAASTTLRGRRVLASNDDVYPEGDAWMAAGDRGSLLLSRHAKASETCEGCGAPCDAREGSPWWSVCLENNAGGARPDRTQACPVWCVCGCPNLFSRDAQLRFATAQPSMAGSTASERR